MKLNAEQIKKALECCIAFKTTADCEGCPSLKHCEESNHWLDEQALSLITSQEQKIKELTEENERLRAENERFRDDMPPIGGFHSD